jgi:hypothetical protein
MRGPPADRVAFEGDLFGIVLPPIPNGPEPVVITAGEAPLSYLAPSFPAAVRHLRVSSSVVWHGGDTVLNQRIRDALLVAEPVLLLTGQAGAFEEAALPAYGLTVTTRCLPVVSRLDDGLRLCLVEPLVDR